MVGPAADSRIFAFPRAGYDSRVYPRVRKPFCRVAVIALSALLAVSGCVTAPDNAAIRSMKPFLAGLGSIRSKPICDYGDNGYGTDNDIPWYQVYLYVDTRPDVDDVVRSAARNAGYPLAIDQPVIDAYPYVQPDGTISGEAGPGADDVIPGVPFDLASTYLIHGHGRSTFRVAVVRAGQVKLECPIGGNIKAYGQTRSVRPGQTLVVAVLTLPSTVPARR
jgi:hypothetical protein